MRHDHRAPCHRLHLALLLALLVVETAGPGRAMAETRIVGAAESYTSIQAAIDDSDHGDTVLVRPGAYVEALTIQRAITVRADDDTVIVRPPDGAGDTGVLHILSGQFGEATTEIAGLVLRGGHGWQRDGDGTRYGGAVLVDSLAIATLTDCTIDSSSADRGGAVAVWADASLILRGAAIDSNTASMNGGGLHVAGTLVCSASTVRHNTSGAAGGGIALLAGAEAIIVDTVIDSNLAVEGGGGLWLAGSARLDSLSITGNAVAVDTLPAGLGGGLYAAGAGRVAMTRLDAVANRAARGGGIALAGSGGRWLGLDSSVRDNVAAELGGGIHVAEGIADSTVRIAGVTVTGNVVRDDGAGPIGGRGGGIDLEGAFAVELDSLDVRDNAAGLGGGIAVAGGGAHRITRSIVARNQASDRGGGLYLASDTGADTGIDFLTIDSNLAVSGGGGGVYVASSAAVAIENSIIANHGSGAGGIVCGGAVLAYCARWMNDPEDLAGCPLGTGGIVADPRFLGGDPFDYGLRFNSPCIDAADPGAAVPPGGNQRADIGAREFASGPAITSLVLDPDDPAQDGLYTTGDEIVLVVSGRAEEPDIATTVTADFDDVENATFNPASVHIEPLAATLPAFAFRVSYTIVMAPPGLDGAERSITVTATTSVGGATSATLAVLIDSRAPGPPAFDTPADTDVTSASFLVSGAAAGADSVHVFLNDEDEESPAARVATAGGRFSATLTLVPGDNTISAVALDLAGNSSISARLAGTVRLVSAFSIEFPKRFTPGDVFTISMPVANPGIEIAVFNLAGQLVRTLRAGGSELTTLSWDGANERGERVNAGPYLVRFTLADRTTGEQRTEHRALVLMKGGSQP